MNNEHLALGDRRAIQLVEPAAHRILVEPLPNQAGRFTTVTLRQEGVEPSSRMAASTRRLNCFSASLNSGAAR
jgi:hypothetical protein